MAWDRRREQYHIIVMPLHKTTPLNAQSAALEASRVISTHACTIYGITVFNGHTESLFIQVFDATTVPAEGTLVNADLWKVQPNQVAMIDYGDQGKRFTVGAVVLLSSTGSTKTIAGNVGLFFARYRNT